MLNQDYIEIKDQKIYAYHGVLDEEKRDGQCFYISFKAYLDMGPSAEADEMTLSVSYADMCQTVKKAVTETVYDLIETVADRTAKALLMAHPLLNKVVLTVKKPSAPVGEPVEYPAVTVERGWHMVYVAMGSNIGESRRILEDALKDMNKSAFLEVTKSATIIETDPWGVTDQANFYNTVAECRTLLSPRQLMTLLLEIEKNYGRERDLHWGPRTLDLDILLYDDLITADPYVTLPHPYMTERAFVLEPLAEIAPNVLEPMSRRRISDLMKALDLKKESKS